MACGAYTSERVAKALPVMRSAAEPGEASRVRTATMGSVRMENPRRAGVCIVAASRGPQARLQSHCDGACRLSPERARRRTAAVARPRWRRRRPAARSPCGRSARLAASSCPAHSPSSSAPTIRAAPLILCACRVSAGRSPAARAASSSARSCAVLARKSSSSSRVSRGVATGQRIQRGQLQRRRWQRLRQMAQRHCRQRRRRAPAHACAAASAAASRSAPGCRPAWPGSRPCRRRDSVRPRLSAPTRSGPRSACAGGHRALLPRGSCAPAGSRRVSACARRCSSSA